VCLASHYHRLVHTSIYIHDIGGPLFSSSSLGDVNICRWNKGPAIRGLRSSCHQLHVGSSARRCPPPSPHSICVRMPRQPAAGWSPIKRHFLGRDCTVLFNERATSTTTVLIIGRPRRSMSVCVQHGLAATRSCRRVEIGVCGPSVNFCVLIPIDKCVS